MAVDALIEGEINPVSDKELLFMLAEFCADNINFREYADDCAGIFTRLLQERGYVKNDDEVDAKVLHMIRFFQETDETWDKYDENWKPESEDDGE